MNKNQINPELQVFFDKTVKNVFIGMVIFSLIASMINWVAIYEIIYGEFSVNNVRNVKSIIKGKCAISKFDHYYMDNMIAFISIFGLVEKYLLVPGLFVYIVFRTWPMKIKVNPIGAKIKFSFAAGFFVFTIAPYILGLFTSGLSIYGCYFGWIQKYFDHFSISICLHLLVCVGAPVMFGWFFILMVMLWIKSFFHKT